MTVIAKKPLPAKRRVFLADDHPIIRKGLAAIINQESDLTVCGEAEDIAQAAESIPRLNPDVAVVDLRLSDESGLELLKTLQQRVPDLPVLVLSMHDESFYAERVLNAGAKGYVMKQEAPECVVGAIRKVANGGIYLSPRMSAQVLSKFSGSRGAKDVLTTDLLSKRELEIFRLTGQGIKPREIAEQLSISVKTVQTHRQNIRRKMKLSSANQLLQQAVQWVLSQ